MLCPDEPWNRTVIVPSGRPAPPYLRVSRLPSMVPTVRLMFRMGRLNSTRSPRASAGSDCSINWLSSAASSPWSCGSWQ